MQLVYLKALMKEHRLRGYSKLRKAELIAFLREQSTRPTPMTPPRPIPTPRPPPATCTRHLRHTRPPPPPPWQTQSVRLRPDRPRQPELLRQLEERNPQPVRPILPPTSRPTQEFKPYQLKLREVPMWNLPLWNDLQTQRSLSK